MGDGPRPRELNVSGGVAGINTGVWEALVP